jgi:hypothetical protein
MRTDSMDATNGKITGYAAQLMDHRHPDRYPLWMWWNLLSLDAPTIVCLWALLFVRQLHLSFQPWEIAALTFAVWIIYISDRVLDGLRTPSLAITSDRHKFYMRHGRAILCALPPIILAAGLMIFLRLGGQTRFAGLIMSAAVIFYFLGIHGVPDHVNHWFPKEIAAGGIFAAGAAIPAWLHAAGLRNSLMPELLLFAGLCGLNCVSIECWEHNRGERRWEKQPYWLIRLTDTRIEMIAATLILCASCIVLFVSLNGIRAETAEASILSLLCLMAIERRSNNLSPQAVRILADVALLTPAVFLLRW